jgi:nucleoside-diphosphate-sugar epimerase
MRIFLTGATGFVGSAIIPELIDAGHQVLGLTRSETGAEALLAAGAEVHRGNIEDLDSLKRGAANADGVIHCGFNHDFSKFMQNCENDKLAIEAMASVLAGSDRPLVITSGTAFGSPAPGQLATEDVFNTQNPHPRIASELAGVAALEGGVNVSVVRLPQVHDPVKQGLITYIVAIARQQGKVAYIGDGLNRWPAAHVSDVARLYRLVVEKHQPGSRYNAVGEEGVPSREICDALGRGLKMPVKSLTPEEAQVYFGWMSSLAALDMPASSALTQERLNWHPTGPGLISDLEAMDYSKA